MSGKGSRRGGSGGAGDAALVGALAALLAVAFGATACGGTCADLESAWEIELRREQAIVGTGLTPLGGGAAGGGNVHLGLTFSESFLQELRTPIDEAMPLLETRVSAGDRTERRAAVEIRAEPVLERISLFGTARLAIVLEIAVDTRVIVRRPGTRREHTLPGRATVTGALELREDDDGDVVLFVRPFLETPVPDAPLLDVVQTVGELSPSVAETVRTFVEPGIREMLTRLPPIPILRFTNPVVAGLVIDLAPAELRVLPDVDSVFVGLVTNLRPAAVSGVGPLADVSLAGLRYFVHPGLPAAAIRLALAEGAIARTFGEDGEPDPDGPMHVSLAGLTLRETSFELAFQAWDLGNGGGCALEPVALSGDVALTKGAVELRFAAPTAPPAPEDEPALDWRDTLFVTRSLDLVHALIDPKGVVLGDGSLLPLAPSGLLLEPERIEVLFSR